MDPEFPYLHPNPGWSKNHDEQNIELKEISPPQLIGKHCILELYECHPFKINDEAFVRTTLTSASKIAGAKLLNMITHRFHPQGITGLALLAESHISIHTWPESRYAAIDVFTCGQQTMPQLACKLLAKEFEAESQSLKSFIRDTPSKLLDIVRQPK